MAHSIPEPSALAIRTPLGLVWHTGDWKIDPDPLIGETTDEAALRRIADYLGVAPSAGAWPRILEYTSFAWMKQHSERFDGLSAEIPPIKPGGMVRKGEAGRAHEDGMTAALAADLHAAAREWCADEAAIAWMYAGGPLP